MPDQSPNLSLDAVQAAMHHYMVSGDLSPELEAMVNDDGLSAAARLQIHANNYSLSLKGVLAGSFPLTEAFLGEVFFAGMAGEFAKKHPPSVPVLAAWGAQLPAFVADFEHTADMPWLADVAALEWAIQESGNAADERIADLGQAPENLQISASARLVSSKWPLMMLWMVGQGQLQPEAIKLDSGGQNVLVVRQRGAVKLHVIGESDAYLFEGLVENFEGFWEQASGTNSPLDGFDKDLFVFRTTDANKAQENS